MTSSPITTYLQDIHARIARVRDGVPYEVGPAGTLIDPDHFGIALATVDGYVYEVGVTDHEFSMQSISKPFSYGLALDDLGMAAVDAKIDVEPSGDAFNDLSLTSGTSRPANAMINAGALAVASLIKGGGGRSAVQRITELYSQCAGRPLRSAGRAYQAERRHSDRNHGLAYLLSSVGVIEGRPTEALATYLRQCTVQVTCRDLALMAATLANGGTHPITGTQALTLDAVERVLSVMMTSGMYDDAGDWASHVGMPAKSGVGGGIIAVLPGQAGLAVYSPPLDRHGNSVRGVAACRQLSRDMEMHFVRSARIGRSAIRDSYPIDREPSAIRRTDEATELLAEHAHRAVVVELAGDLFFAGTESVVRELTGLDPQVELVVLDVRRVDEFGRVALDMLGTIAEQFARGGATLLLVDPEDTLAHALPELATFESREGAIARCEHLLLERYGSALLDPGRVLVADSPALAMLDQEDVDALAGLMERRSFADGEIIRRVGQRFGGVFFILSGRISTITTDSDGNRVRVTALGAGMTFGDLSLASEDRQEATVKATGPVEVMVLDAEAIDELEDRDPRLAIQLWRALARDAHSRVYRYARAVAVRIRD
ncbi:MULTISPECIES: glutaminase A [unclassified Pseudactinotalea]|uniref:glutaminase A n=1 Tax=unclassified Pseudactinotalea TaxID=2649176 RepID=UPI00128BB0A5|nr:MULTISPECIES: glutaminase A [unclassified Pseudactinotalea]MPV49254.1 glutaminase A [Pseudactinotalea sp. HY160]QGH69448.1 glutaminase A [Pseudactinotalea sp. HY158]